MRTMFRTVKTTNPEIKSKILFRIVVEDMKAKKVANVAKAISEYIPEQGMSTEKLTCCPAAVVSISVGAPKSFDNVTGKKVFVIV